MDPLLIFLLSLLAVLAMFAIVSVRYCLLRNRQLQSTGTSNNNNHRTLDLEIAQLNRQNSVKHDEQKLKKSKSTSHNTLAAIAKSKSEIDLAATTTNTDRKSVPSPKLPRSKTAASSAGSPLTPLLRRRVGLSSENLPGNPELTAQQLTESTEKINIAVDTGVGDAKSIARSLQTVSVKNAAMQIARLSTNQAADVLAQFSVDERRTAVALQLQKNENESRVHAFFRNVDEDVNDFDPKSIASVLEDLTKYQAAKLITKLSVDQALLTLAAFSSPEKRQFVLQILEELSLSFEIENPGWYETLTEKLKALE